MSEDGKLKGQAIGPAIVSVANAARAFDAPVRYPVLFRAPHLFEDSLKGTMAFPRMSSFIAMIEHLFGFIILMTFIEIGHLLKELKAILKNLSFKEKLKAILEAAFSISLKEVLYRLLVTVFWPIFLSIKAYKKVKEIVKDFNRKEWFAVIFISFGGSALGLFFFLISFALGNPTIAILLQKAQPLITLIFAFFILKERPSYLFWITLGLAIVGIGLIVTPDIQASVQTFDYTGLIAILCSLIAATLWGGSTVFGRILTKKVKFWDLTLLRYIGGFIFLIVFNVVLFTYNGEYFSLLAEKVTVFKADWAWELPIGVGIIYFALLTGGVIPLALYYFGLKRSKASIAGIAELAFPLLAIFVNWYFLGWGLNRFQAIGAGILFLAVSVMSFVNAREMEKKRQLNKLEEQKDTNEEK